MDIMPCWKCAGLTVPTSVVPNEYFCQGGNWHKANDLPELSSLFRDYQLVVVCVGPSTDSVVLNKTRLEHFPPCTTPRDVDCIAWNVADHLVYERPTDDPQLTKKLPP